MSWSVDALLPFNIIKCDFQAEPLSNIQCNAGEHIQRAAVRRQGGQISDDLTIVVIDMLPPGTTFPDVASRLTRSTSNGSMGSGGKPVRTKSVQRTNSFMSFFRCGSEPIVLEEFEPSFHDPSVRDPSTRGRGDYSNHADVNIIADVDSYVEFAHLSPMSVARKRHHQLPVQQQHVCRQQHTCRPAIPSAACATQGPHNTCW